jgi:hypothetical protein
MAISPDDEVRAAAIEQVRKLRDLHGGRIPRHALMQGMGGLEVPTAPATGFRVSCPRR